MNEKERKELDEDEEERRRTNRIPLPQMKVKDTTKAKSQGRMKRMRGASVEKEERKGEVSSRRWEERIAANEAHETAWEERETRRASRLRRRECVASGREGQLRSGSNLTTREKGRGNEN